MLHAFCRLFLSLFLALLFFLLDEKRQRGMQPFQERYLGDFCRVTALFSWGFHAFLADLMTAASYGSSGLILTHWGLDCIPGVASAGVPHPWAVDASVRCVCVRGAYPLSKASGERPLAVLSARILALPALHPACIAVTCPA